MSTTEISRNSEEYKMIADTIMTMMGVNRMAYIKPRVQGEDSAFIVYAADGTEIAEFECHDEAYRSIMRHKMTPVRVH